MFVQKLRSDLSLVIGPFMLNTLQEAINRAQICEMIFARGMSVCEPALYHQLAYATTQAPISPLHQLMYPVNQLVTPAQPLNASMKQEAYMVKRKCIDEKPSEVEPLPRKSCSDGDIQASKQASNQKSEQGSSKKVIKKK
ncbi:2574_t:CDS:2, partial [Cetraspora pellucida]